MRLILINPNTNAATTDAMVRIAREAAGAGVIAEGRTAPDGPPLITTEADLAAAGAVVAAMAPDLAGADAVIVAAFGDPGVAALRAALSCPVTGIGEAGMAEAAHGGRRFAVVTTTPGLRDAIAAMARRAGHAGFAGTWVTPGDPSAVMSDPSALLLALTAGCRAAIGAGAEAIVIGGGPLAAAARVLAGTLPVTLIEPVPAAVRLTLERLSP